MLVAAREYFSEGGRSRLQHTLPPLLFSALALAKRTMEREKKAAAGEEEPPKFSTRQVLKYTQQNTRDNATKYTTTKITLSPSPMYLVPRIPL